LNCLRGDSLTARHDSSGKRRIGLPHYWGLALLEAIVRQADHQVNALGVM
jgi:hypothetical protein